MLPLQAAELYSRTINSGNGLPDNNIRNVAIDRQGFLWLGTPNGLYRYDGYFFTLFRHDQEANALLYTNHINGLRSLSSGQMLVRQQGDLYSLYDVDRGGWLDMSVLGKRPQFRYYAEVDTTLWLWEENGAAVAYRYAEGELKYELYNSADVPHPERETEGYRRAQQLLHAGGWETIIFDNRLNPCVIDRTGRLVWLDRHSGRQVQLHVFESRLIPLVDSRKYVVCTSPDGRYTWVSTNGSGITLYDHTTQEQRRIDSRSGLLATDFLISMTMDEDGNIFVCDDAHGVEVIAAPQTDVTHLMIQDNAPSFRTNRVAILRPLGTDILVANTIGNTMLLDTATLTLRPYPQLDGKDVHTVLRTSNGEEWVGTRQRGLHNKSGAVYMHDPANPASIASNNVMDLYEDAAGRLWVANYNASLDLLTAGGFRHFFPEADGFRVLTEDTHGRMWAGGKSGLYVFRADELIADSSRYIHVLTKEQVNYSDISDLCEDADGGMWVSTLGNGVFYMRGNTIVRHLTAADGLMSDYVHSLVIDNAAVLWMATQRGITCYTPATGATRHIYDNYNLLRNVYSDNAACRLPNGRLLFGTDEGISVFNPERTASAHARQPRITDLLVNNTPLPSTDRQSVRLHHNENTLTFRFSSFNYHSTAGTLYSYRMDGVDRTWSEPQPYSFALYRNLRPGHYTFRVRAYDNNAVSEECSVAVRILRPWWATWWAIVLYMVLAVSLTLIIYRQVMHMQALRNRLKMEQELTDYKMLFFTNISHEFRTPLTIIRSAIDRISSLNNIPLDMRQPIASMQVSTERMLRLVSQLLSFRMAQQGTLQLHLEETEVIGFLREIYLNFYLWAERKHISLDFHTSHRTYTMPADRWVLEMVAYNLISNAIKYTPQNGHVVIRTGIENGVLSLRVSDDGIGITPERREHVFDAYMHTSFSSANASGIGLHFTRTLVELHHGTIAYTPAEPNGSVFEVMLPAEASAYRPDEFMTEEQQARNAAIATPDDNRHDSAALATGATAAPYNDRYALVVDDDEELREYIATLLGQYFHVETAEDGVDAWRRIEERQPDLVVSDVMMSVLDGYELVSRIRKDERTRSIPVVLLSALASDDKRVRAMRAGADAYLTKPFDTKLLIATCQSLLQRHDQLKQSYAGEVVEKKDVLPEIVVEARDKEFLKQLENITNSHIADPQLSVDFLSDKMQMGRTLFFKRVKTLTGMTPADYIRSARMRKAAELLSNEKMTVAEASYKVGIEDSHYFIKLFKQQYGITPKKYQKGQKE